jgi:hypothetical protein
MRFLKAYLEHQADRSTRLRALWTKIRDATQEKLLERGQVFGPAPGA